MKSLQLNAIQVNAYIKSYSDATLGFPKDKMEHLAMLLEVRQLNMNDVQRI